MKRGWQQPQRERGMGDLRAGAESDIAAWPVGALSEEDRLRAQTYSLLSHLLADVPDRELLSALASIDDSDEEPQAPLLAASWRMLAEAAARATPEEIKDEYQELFIGVGRGELVPYASWYLTGFLMEQPLATLRADLRGLGFERETGVLEPEDHAAALCAAMALIAGEAGVDSEARQRTFFQRHMAPWMGQFFRDLQQTPSARFYRAVGQLGEQFIEIEQLAFSMSLPPAAEARASAPVSFSQGSQSAGILRRVRESAP